MGSRRWLVVIGIAVALGVGASVGVYAFIIRPALAPKYDSSGLPRSPVSYKTLLKYPEGRLRYPGATVVSEFGHDELSAGSAEAGEIMRTADTADQVYAWYREYLTSHGWHRRKVGQLDTMLSDEGWGRGDRESMIIAIDNPAALTDIGHPIAPGGTLFEYRYSIFGD